MPCLLSLNSYHYRRGGADVVYFEHEAMFAKLGWQTAHMAMHHPRNEPSPWSGYFVDEIEFGHRYGNWDKLAKACKVVYSFEARRKLKRLLERVRPSVAHVHCIYHHLSPSVLPLLHERGIPVVLTAHDLKIACPAYKMLNRGGVCERCKSGNFLHVVAQRCVRDSLAASAVVAVESTLGRLLGLYRDNLSHIVTPSRFYLRKLAEWGWPTERMIHIPNYVSTERFVPRFEPGDYFVYFGRLSTEKGISTLIRAATAAGVKLVIAGTGPLDSQARELATGANIVFTGHLAGEPLWSLVRDSRAVVLPSEWYENAPMSVLEAFALGKPVIGADIGGIPELISEGETGLIFQSARADSLTDAIRRLAAMPDSAVRELGMHARKTVERDYSADRYQEAMQSLYASLIGSRPGELA